MQGYEISFETVIGRLKDLIGVQRDADLARALGVKPEKYTVWKTRRFLPIELIIGYCYEKRYSLNFVLYGLGPIHIVLDASKQISSEERAEAFQVQSELLSIALEKTEIIGESVNKESAGKLRREIAAIKRGCEILKMCLE